MTDISNRLKLLRNKFFGPRGKRRFATALNIPLSSYSTYEAGRTPPPELLVKASEITGCDLQWLMTGKESALAQHLSNPEVTEILNRMERILSAQPKAREAITALMDLLTGETPPASQAPQVLDKETDMITTPIPILGRAAAGLPAFWDDPAGREAFSGLLAMAKLLKPNEIAKKLALPVINANSEKNEGRAEILQLAQPMDFEELILDGFIINHPLKAGGTLFAVTLTGDSMLPMLKPDDLVIADTGRPAANGCVVLAELADHVGAMCKIFFRDGDQIRLTSANRKYDPMISSSDKLLWAFQVVAAIKR